MAKLTRNKEMNPDQWPWVLSSAGKKVLRPGGRELTMKLLDSLNITPEDDVVEFAPGIGFTAGEVLKKKPKSYTGIELNEEAGERLQKIIKGEHNKIVISNANKADTNLKNDSKDKVFGEAMLTMHHDQRKSDIIQQAYNLLRKGGRYGIHEMCIEPDDISLEEKRAIEKDLSSHSHVNTRPLTKSGWVNIIEQGGFKVREVWIRPMLLLEPARFIKDEGILNAGKVLFNILKNKKRRKKVREMRALFKSHRNAMRAICIIAEKI